MDFGDKKIKFLGIAVDVATLIDYALRATPLIAWIVFKFKSIESGTALEYAVLIFFGMYFIKGFFTNYFNKQRWIAGLPNPYVYIVEKKVECHITEDRGCQRRDISRIRALKDNEVCEFRGRIGRTAAKGIKLDVPRECGTLHEYTFSGVVEYVVCFAKLSRQNNKKLEHTVVKDWHVKSLAGASFLDQTFMACRGCGSYKALITFPKKDLPKEVYYYKTTPQYVRVNQPIRLQLEESTFKDRMQATYEINGPDIDNKHHYIIDWEWDKVDC